HSFQLENFYSRRGAHPVNGYCVSFWSQSATRASGDLVDARCGFSRQHIPDVAAEYVRMAIPSGIALLAVSLAMVAGARVWIRCLRSSGRNAKASRLVVNLGDRRWGNERNNR